MLLSLLLLLLMSVLLRTLPEQPPRSEDVVEIDINVYHVGNRRLVSAANVLGCAGRKKTTWSGRDYVTWPIWVGWCAGEDTDDHVLRGAEGLEERARVCKDGLNTVRHRKW